MQKKNRNVQNFKLFVPLKVPSRCVHSAGSRMRDARHTSEKTRN